MPGCCGGQGQQREGRAQRGQGEERKTRTHAFKKTKQRSRREGTQKKKKDTRDTHTQRISWLLGAFVLAFFCFVALACVLVVVVGCVSECARGGRACVWRCQRSNGARSKTQKGKAGVGSSRVFHSSELLAACCCSWRLAGWPNTAAASLMVSWCVVICIHPCLAARGSLFFLLLRLLYNHSPLSVPDPLSTHCLSFRSWCCCCV